MKRRDFVQKSSLAVAGALAAPSIMAATAEEKIKKFGFQSYTVRDVIYKDMAGTLKKLRKAGYDFFEGFDFGNGKLLRKPIAEAKQIIEDSKMEMPSIHVVTANMKDPGTWQQSVDDAAELGAKYIVCAYLMPNEREKLDQYKELTELFNKCGETAKKSGLQFGYHNHDFEFMDLEGEMPMNVILNECDSDLVKLELDIYWVRYAEKDPIKFFRDNMGRVPLWHVKDLSLDEGRPMTEVGNGIIDWQQVFRYKGDAGMQYFFVEQDRNFKTDSVTSLTTSIKHLKSLDV